MGFAKTLLAVFVGLLLIAAAAAGWKFWEVNGFIAFLLGCVGVSIVGVGFGAKLE